MLGVIGGMGPLATADFFRKLIAATPATSDEQHIPVLIHSVPQIPSRPAAILRGGPAPLPELLRARDRLLAAGATLLAMPCNTAHHWYPDLTQGCSVPFVHIVDAVAAVLDARRPADPTQRCVGLIATEATLAARIYDQGLVARQLQLLTPDAREYRAAVQPAIDAVKSNASADGGRLIEPVVRSLLARGAGCVVLACTEIPIALDAIDSPLRAQCIDSTDALARACIKTWQSLPPSPNL
jgi:aspartate racemase